jgi:PKD repeat protein
MTVSHAYVEDGSYEVKLTVTDDDASSVMTTAVETILNRIPVSSFLVSPQQLIAGETIIFNATGSYDSDGTIVDLTWDFGDGNMTTTSSRVVTHIYHDCGEFSVTLTVVDNDNYNDSTSHLINIHVHDVVILAVTVSQTDVHIGHVITITVTTKNEGTTTESFNVAVFRNESLIGTQLVSNLTSDTEKKLEFYWDTSNITDAANYLIQIKADAVSGESNVLDNTYVSDVVKVSKVQTDENPLQFSLDLNQILLIGSYGKREK